MGVVRWTLPALVVISVQCGIHAIAAATTPVRFSAGDEKRDGPHPEKLDSNYMGSTPTTDTTTSWTASAPTTDTTASSTASAPTTDTTASSTSSPPTTDTTTSLTASSPTTDTTTSLPASSPTTDTRRASLTPSVVATTNGGDIDIIVRATGSAGGAAVVIVIFVIVIVGRRSENRSSPAMRTGVVQIDESATPQNVNQTDAYDQTITHEGDRVDTSNTYSDLIHLDTHDVGHDYGRIHQYANAGTFSTFDINSTYSGLGLHENQAEVHDYGRIQHTAST